MWETGSSLQESYNPKRVKLLSCSCVTCFARSVNRSGDQLISIWALVERKAI